MSFHWRNMDRGARIVAITTLRDAGHSRSAIAAELRVSMGSLHGFAFRQNIQLASAAPRTGGWYDLTTEAKVEQMAGLIAKGMSTAEIAAELGLSLGSVYRFCWAQRIAVTNKKIKARIVEPPMVPDERYLRPDAWVPLAEPVGFEANTGCCWPVDGGWCGQPKAKRSYCAAHHSMAYPTKARLSEDNINWLAAEDERASNRRQRVSAPVSRPVKREAVRYDE